MGARTGADRGPQADRRFFGRSIVVRVTHTREHFQKTTVAAKYVIQKSGKLGPGFPAT